MRVEHDVAIIGSGPYGLSLAAHLRERKVNFQIFGEPMQFWRDHMPKGMQLKSDGFASNLYDPQHDYTLRRYCQEQGLSYKDTRLPVDLGTFVKYGIAFKSRFTPELRTNNVLKIDKVSNGFALRLDNDELVNVRRIVVATGIRDCRHIPTALKGLPSQHVTHSSEHHELAALRKRDVVVLGAGASAVDLAALLLENDVSVRLVARDKMVRFHSAQNTDRSVLQRLRHPSSGIGPGLRTRFYCDAPGLFHYLPEKLRLLAVQRTLGPAGGWFMKDRIIGRVPLLVGSTIEKAQVKGDRVHLSVRGPNQKVQELLTDHVIAATGYNLDLHKFEFLSSEIRSGVTAINNTPVLSSSMESSVPGLFFMGAITANSFGPVMRFAFGARFAAPRVARALRSAA